MKRATLFTSIPPKTVRMIGDRDFGTVYQEACIASWVAAGFEVISINPESEIEQLKACGYQVKYISSPNPRPKIVEFMNAASSANHRLVGIINADCLLLGIPDFIQGTLAGAERGLVLIERVNVDPVSLLPTGQTCLGFDAFFFDRSLASKLEIDAELAVGQPWWDYWFPATFAVGGVPLIRTQSPLIFHLDHPQGWSQTRWLDFGRKFIDHFGSVDETLHPVFLAAVRAFQTPEVMEREDLGGFGDWCFNWLRDHAVFLDVSENPTAAELFGRILAAMTNFDGMHASTLALARVRGELAEVENLRTELASLRAQVAVLSATPRMLPGMLYRFMMRRLRLRSLQSR